MPGYPFLLAAAPTLETQVQEATRRPLFNTREALLIIGVSLIVGLVLFLWAYFKFRKKPGVEFGPGQSPHAIPSKPEAVSSSSGRRRKRHRRRDHRPRNPTLDQTGGLPPPRADGELPKY
jgi:hypothetical protein